MNCYTVVNDIVVVIDGDGVVVKRDNQVGCGDLIKIGSKG